MAEEFTESEVVFSDHQVTVVAAREEESCQKKRVANSMPINIPEKMVKEWGCREEEAEEEEEEMTPPHEIMRRRLNGKMKFSVCTGNGRTLKGRDLSQVRNSILRLTGFLEV